MEPDFRTAADGCSIPHSAVYGMILHELLYISSPLSNTAIRTYINLLAELKAYFSRTVLFLLLDMLDYYSTYLNLESPPKAAGELVH